MELKQFRPAVAQGVLTSDRCARSGLKAPQAATFASIYTTDLEPLRRFYTDLFGADKINFEADDMLIFDVADTQSILIQRVAPDSAFAKLRGSQSMGLVGDFKTPKSKSIDVSSDLGWKDEVVAVHDPDGNMITIASPQNIEAVNTIAAQKSA